MNILSLEGLYFVPYLRRLGHNVLAVGPAQQGGPLDVRLPRPVALEELLDLARAQGFSPDVLLWNDTCRPPLVLGLERFPGPSIGYSIDQYVNPWHVPLAAAFDVILLAQKDYLPLFAPGRDEGSLRWLPLFCDPDSSPPPSGESRDIAVSFVGTPDPPLNPGRAPFLAAFAALCPLSRASGDFRPVFGRSQIVLNQSAAGELNFRIFEAASLGAAVLTEDTGCGLLELFTPGQDILPPYPRGDAAAAAAVARRYLANPSGLARVAAAGTRLVRSRHSAAARAREISRLAGELTASGRHLARLADPAKVRKETAKAYVFLATDESLGLPLALRQAYMDLAREEMARP